MPGTFSLARRVSDPDMHHGACMPQSLTSGFHWSRWRGKRPRHSRHMRNQQSYVSGKRPMVAIRCIPFPSLTEYGCDGIQWKTNVALRWRHNGRHSVSNHQPHDCLLNRLFRRRSKKTSARVTGLCAGNSPGTGEFPTQMASNAENVSIWWRHHGFFNPTSTNFIIMKFNIAVCHNNHSRPCLSLGYMLDNAINEWNYLK